MDGKTHGFAPDGDEIIYDLGLEPRSRQIAKSATAVSNFYTAFGKRLFDLTFVVLALPIALPLMAVLYVMTRRDGPFLFAHERIGKNGQRFDCLKIRTMDVNAERILADLLAHDPEISREWKRHFKLRNDPRVTKIGRVLRKTSLDELPQILNVLKGEMSVVGPRPITDEELAQYGGAAEDYKKMRPGLTGPWQISGRREADFGSRAALDAAYVSNVNFVDDLSIVFKTIPEVLKAHGH